VRGIDQSVSPDDHCDHRSRAPLLVGRIDAEQDEPIFGAQECPASAARVAARSTVAVPDPVQHRPLQKFRGRQHDQEQDRDRRDTGRQVGEQGLEDRRPSPARRRADRLGMRADEEIDRGHRSTSATWRL
jgi:hypothetical protein